MDAPSRWLGGRRPCRRRPGTTCGSPRRPPAPRPRRRPPPVGRRSSALWRAFFAKPRPGSITIASRATPRRARPLGRRLPLAQHVAHHVAVRVVGVVAEAAHLFLRAARVHQDERRARRGDDLGERVVAQARHVVHRAGAGVEARRGDLRARRVDRDASAAIRRVTHDVEDARELLARRHRRRARAASTRRRRRRCRPPRRGARPPGRAPLRAQKSARRR